MKSIKVRIKEGFFKSGRKSFLQGGQPQWKDLARFF